MSKGKEKFDKVMHEWGQGELRSSSGELVKYPSENKRAIAIAYSEARKVDANYGSGGSVSSVETSASKEEVEEYVNVMSFYVDTLAWHLKEEWDRILWLYSLKSDSDVGLNAIEIADMPSQDVEFLMDSVLEFMEENELNYEDIKPRYDKYIMREGHDVRFYDKGGRVRYNNGGLTDREKLVEKIASMKKQLEDPKTVVMMKKNIEALLPIWEKKLADYKEPEVVKAEPQQPKEPKVEVKKEEVVKEEKPKVVVQKEQKTELPKGEVKAHIEGKISGEFEGTIETEGGKPVKIKERVSVEVESTPTESKPQRNITQPSDKPYWVDIEPYFKDIMRSATGAKKIEKTTKTVGKNYRIYVNSQEVLDQVVNMYNLKRAKEKYPPITASDVSGKFAKGGKLKSAKEVKKEESLRNKAKRMGLIKNKGKLTESDLDKVKQQGPKWKKIVESYKANKK